jgi:probable F420-dependent oxidoreductase
MRPFRFGVSIRVAASRAEWQEKARRAEALGYSTVLVADHLADALPPLLPLVSAADATTTLRVGTFVLNNDFRHPVLVARAAAALDLLTDGRFELGLGAGHMRSEYEGIALQYDPAAARVERLGESVTIVRRLLAGEQVTFAGTHYTVSGQRCFPPGKRRVPILVGGNGRRLLELAARQADIVGLAGFSHRLGGTEVDLSSFTADGAAERVDIVRRAAGTRIADLELNALVQRVVVTDDPRSAAVELAAEFELTPEQVMSSPFLLLGTPTSMAEELVARRERFGFSYVTVFEPALEPLAPVVAQLAAC